MADNRNETDLDATQEEDSFVQGDVDQSVESWQDELPPEDDFHDQDDAVEEILDEIPPDVVAETSNDKNKRGKAILLGALVVGALFIGGLAYLQFASDGKSVSSTIPLARIMDIRALDKINVATKSPEPAAQNAGAGSTDLERLYDTSRVQPANKIALPNGDVNVKEGGEAKPLEAISSDVFSSSSSSSSSSVQPEDKKSVAALAPSQPQVVKTETIPLPRADDLMPASLASAVPVVAETALPKTMVETKEAKDAELRVKALTSQLETLQKSFEQIKQKNDELLAKIDAMGKVQATPSANETVLQQKVALLEKQQTADQKAKAPMMPAAVEPKQVEAEPSQKSAVHAEAKLAKKKVVATQKPKETTKIMASGWVLRAATPDAAWVSAGRDSQELRRVSVGEDLPGFGKVKEIRQNGDRWELVGPKSVLK